MCLLSNNNEIIKCKCKFRDSCIQRIKSATATQCFTIKSEKKNAVTDPCSSPDILFTALIQPQKKDAFALTSFNLYPVDKC
jgi:hypothetical protein